MDTAEAFAAAVQRHDLHIASVGLAIWVGSEPTFTNRLAQSPGGSIMPERRDVIFRNCTRFGIRVKVLQVWGRPGTRDEVATRSAQAV